MRVIFILKIYLRCSVREGVREAGLGSMISKAVGLSEIDKLHHQSSADKDVTRLEV